MTNRPAIPADIKREILLECGHRCAVCGTSCPLERAHIIPWHKSKEHKAEDMICLCANCHERADKEHWGSGMLKEYKRRPWVMRQYEGKGSVVETTTTARVTLTIEELPHFDETFQKLLPFAIAAFLDIPSRAVRIISIEKGSLKIIMELPEESAERLLAAYKRRDSELHKYLDPLILLELRRESPGRGKRVPYSYVGASIGQGNFTKRDLVKAVANIGMTKKQAGMAVDAVLSGIKKALAKGDRVVLPGFGTFAVKKRAAREGRNPRTGRRLKIPAKKVPVFQPSKGLKDTVS